jgi:hypothetical protein
MNPRRHHRSRLQIRLICEGGANQPPSSFFIAEDSISPAGDRGMLSALIQAIQGRLVLVGQPPEGGHEANSGR